MKTLLTNGLAVLLLLAVAGCEIDATTGPEGPPGPPGAPGNANVFTLNFTFSMVDAIINDNVASVQFDAPDVSPSVVDEGAVLMFFREQGTWTAMPYVFAYESPDLAAVDYTVNLGFGYEVDFLEVFYEASTDAIDLTDQPDRQIKAVVIDGFPFGKTDVDLTDYEAVKAYFGF